MRVKKINRARFGLAGIAASIVMTGKSDSWKVCLSSLYPGVDYIMDSDTHVMLGIKSVDPCKNKREKFIDESPVYLLNDLLNISLLGRLSDLYPLIEDMRAAILEAFAVEEGQ